MWMQWRRLHGHGGHVPLNFYKWLGTEHREYKNSKANNILTELYWPSRKRSRKRLIVLVEPNN